MNFGDILEEWERQRRVQESSGPGAGNADGDSIEGEHSGRTDRGAESGEKESVARRELLRWLDGVDDWEEIQRAKEEYPDSDTSSGSSMRGGYGHKSRTQLRKMAPEETLDLHGMTMDDAEKALRLFIENAHARRLRKVLIIHGKGNHSEGGAVLRDMVHAFLEKNRHAGETGTPGRDYGGRGATWCLLK